jgi:hypothetical protein
MNNNSKDKPKNNKVITIKNFFAGLFLVLFLSLFGGFDGFQSILFTLAFAVVCTAGISLLIIVPLFCLLGWFAIEIYKFSQRQKQSVATEQEDSEVGYQGSNSFSQAQQSLNNYILQIFNNPGISLTVINQLKQRGWNDQQISTAIDWARKFSNNA